VLLYAASWCTSLSHACSQLRGAPSHETIRQALLNQLPGPDELQRRLNRLLATSFKQLRRRWQRGYPVAVDLTPHPYYGQDTDSPYVCRGKFKAGTHYFLTYATAYLVLYGQRYTLALTPVRRHDKIEEVLKHLLRQVQKTSLHIRYVLLDRGFYKVQVIRYLQAARYPFLMPLIGRGKKPAGGTRRFTTRTSSGWFRYQLQDRSGTKATVSVCVHCRNHAGRKGKHGRYAWAYAYWGLRPGSYRWVSQTYRSRFGIESSYRQLNQGRARTSSRNVSLRLLYAGVALVLRNLWVWWHWEVLAEGQGRRRRLHLEVLTLQALLERIAQACLEALGGLRELQTPRPVPV